MQFCSECSSMMVKKETSEGIEYMECKSCGNNEGVDDETEFVSTNEQEDLGVIETEEGDNFEGKPSTDDVNCDECGYEEAWYTIKQTASADEPPTRFFKCQDCGNRWREYS